MTVVGYARVSTQDQNTDMQMDALNAAACERVFVEKASGVDRERPQLAKCLNFLRAGDVLVVWKLDRLGRSLAHLIEIVDGLRAKGVGFRSLSDPIDTTSHAGRLIFQIFGAVAEYERSIMKERVAAGLAAARERGRVPGRRFKHDPETRRNIVRDAMTNSAAAACDAYGISRSTLGRYAREQASPS